MLIMTRIIKQSFKNDTIYEEMIREKNDKTLTKIELSRKYVSILKRKLNFNEQDFNRRDKKTGYIQKDIFLKQLKDIVDLQKYKFFVKIIDLYIEDIYKTNIREKEENTQKMFNSIAEMEIPKRRDEGLGNLTKKKLILLEEKNQSKKKIKEIRSFSENNKSDENDTKKIIPLLELGIEINYELEEYRSGIENSDNTIHFDNLEFGSLKKKDMLFINELNLDEHYKKVIKKKEEEIPMIDEIINFSLESRVINTNPTEENKLLISFYSNLLYNILYKKIITLNEIQQTELYKDLQKIIIMMVFLSKSLESNISKLSRLSEYLNYKSPKLKSPMTKLFSNKAFSKESFLTKEELDEVIKNGFKDTNDTIFKEMDETTNNVYKRINKDDISIKDNLENFPILNKSKEIKSKILERPPLLNIYELMKEFTLTYDKTIENGFYSRPSVIFDNSLSSINKMLIELNEATQNNDGFSFWKKIKFIGQTGSIQY